MKSFFQYGTSGASSFEAWLKSGFGITTLEQTEVLAGGDLCYLENTFIGNIKNNSLTGFWILKRDVTERRRVEEALAESEVRFRQIYEDAPVMMHSIDESGAVRNVNKAWLDEMGYAREEVIGQKIAKFMVSESAL